MYLEQDRDAAESSAFEARYRTAPQRMRALAWCGPESLASSPFAREQLSAVRAACSDAMGRPVDWDMRPPGQRVERGERLRRLPRRGRMPGGVPRVPRDPGERTRSPLCVTW
ncbi:DUF6584 family protein [Streptomyces sp. NPDC052036]|uniref:DUF6584 family protein n=1 Tax=Streptomyces sp. NPDC052036 TaxID=3155171 RepID=UPI0034154E95